VDLFGQNRSESGLTWLVFSNHSPSLQAAHHVTVAVLVNIVRNSSTISTVIGTSRNHHGSE